MLLMDGWHSMAQWLSFSMGMPHGRGNGNGNGNGTVYNVCMHSCMAFDDSMDWRTGPIVQLEPVAKISVGCVSPF